MLNKIFFIIFFSIFSYQFSEAKEIKKSAKPLSNNVSQDKLEDEEFAEFEQISSANKIEIYDPFEKINRKIYSFNDRFDRIILEPLSKAYGASIPKAGRTGIHNFISNLGLPLSAINSIAQGKIDNGLATFSNFLINTTIGILGFRNVAGEKGISYNYEDFGQTLGHYKINSGAYLMLPFFGPSTTRDFGGFAATAIVSPDSFNILEIGGTQTIVDPIYLISLNTISAIDTREGLTQTINDIRQDSFDSYATIRSAFLQKRKNEINK